MKDRSKLTPYQKCIRIYNQLMAESGPINTSLYKWRLGSAAISQIKDESIIENQGGFSDETPIVQTLFRLKVDRAIDDPDCVQIWKDVTYRYL